MLSLPSSMNPRASFSTTVATPRVPASIIALMVSIPIIAPAPITPSPLAANTAIILRMMFLILFGRYLKVYIKE